MTAVDYWDGLNVRQKAGLLAFVGSLVLSFLAFFSDPVINRDGMLYVDMARNIAGHGGTGERFNWPFFSFFLAGVIKVSPFGDVTTSMMVVSLFTAAASAVLAVLLAWHAPARFMFLAVLVALAFPGFNESRSQILRDWPAWFFSLSAIWTLFRFEASGCWRYVLVCVVLLLLGMLCRLEVAGLAMALGLAWGLKTGRRKYLLLGGALTFAALVGLWVVFQGDFGERVQLYVDALNVVTRYETFMTIANEFAAQFIHPYSQEYGGLVLLVGLLSIIPAQLLGVLGPYALVFFTRGAAVSDSEKRIYSTVFVVWFVVLSVFLTAYFLLSSRYVVLLGLVLLPWLFARFVQAYGRWSPRWRAFAVFILAVMALSGAYSSSAREKMFLVKAGDWLTDQMQPVVYFNDPRVSFYAGGTYFMTPMTEPEPAQSGELFVWLLDRSEVAEVVEAHQSSLQQVKLFDTGSDDVVLVMSAL